MNMLHWMGDPEVGRVCLPCLPLRFTDASALEPSPFLNQHEEEVLGRVFGSSAEERSVLREAGAVRAFGRVRVRLRGSQKDSP